MNIDGDIESHAQNSDTQGKLKPKGLLTLLKAPIRKGLLLYMTKTTIERAQKYVNGTQCIGEAYHAVAAAVIVLAGAGRRGAVTRRHDEDIGLPLYPLRPGYASIVMKLQSASSRMK